MTEKKVWANLKKLGVLLVLLCACNSENESFGVGAIRQTLEEECPPGLNVIVGTEADDELEGTNGDDCILGLGGDDVIDGGNGNDYLIGGSGDDVIDGGRGSDSIVGGSGNDVLTGGNGNDTIDGGDGHDTISGDNGGDVLIGGDGNDMIVTGRGGGTVDGGSGIDACDGENCELQDPSNETCDVDSDCPNPWQFCLTTANLCIYCDDDSYCDDESECTIDSCVPAIGCSNDMVLDGTDCSDDDLCNGAETCQQGSCTPSMPLNCDDEDMCTDDFCDPVSGCVSVNNSEPCDNDDVCTINDTCVEGACTGDPIPGCVVGWDCNPVLNTGCSSGERCAIYSRNHLFWDIGCLPEYPDAPGPGEPCTVIGSDPNYGRHDDCTGGSRCTGTYDYMGYCQRLCTDTDATFCTGVYDGEDGVCDINLGYMVGNGIMGCRRPEPCDPVRNEGCPSGERCAFHSLDGYEWESDCLPEYPDASGPGEPCVLVDEPYVGIYDNCAGGSLCIGGTMTERYCMKLCTETDAAVCTGVYDGEDGVCAISIGVLEEGRIRACVIPDNCDPHCQNCQENQQCLPIWDSADHSALSCVETNRDPSLPGTGEAGDECDFVNSCLPGHFCSDAVCRAICNPDLDPSSGSTCEWELCESGACVEVGGFWSTVELGRCL